MDWNTIIVAAITGLFTGGVGVAIVNAVKDKGKASADVEASLSQIAQSLVITYREEVKDLRDRLEAVEKQIQGRDMRIAELERENKDLKQELLKLRTQNEKLMRKNRELGDRILDLEKRLDNGDTANSRKD